MCISHRRDGGWMRGRGGSALAVGEREGEWHEGGKGKEGKEE